MHEAGFASPANHGLCWRRWDFVSGAKSSGGVAREELDVDKAHEETQPTPKNRQQEAQADAPDELLQIDELVPGRGAGHRHQPDLAGISDQEIRHQDSANLLMPDT